MSDHLAPHDDPESSDAMGDPYAEARRLVAQAGVPRRRIILGSRKRQVFAACVILAAIGFVGYQGLHNATEYFQTVGQAVKHKDSLGTKTFRIEGTVEDIAVTRGADTYFNICGDHHMVPVVSSNSPSQLFQRGIPVVLDGHWQGNHYSAYQIMVKHTASYYAAHPGEKKNDELPVSSSCS